jgi:hypothetical protein
MDAVKCSKRTRWTHMPIDVETVTRSAVSIVPSVSGVVSEIKKHVGRVKILQTQMFECDGKSYVC